MLLQDKIRELIDTGRLSLIPRNELCQSYDICSCAIDMPVDNTNVIEKTPNAITRKGTSIFLQPQGFILLGLQHSISMPSDVVGYINGRSSYARLGLVVNMTANIIKPSWQGIVTLECWNASNAPIEIVSGAVLCSISFFVGVGKVESIGVYSSNQEMSSLGYPYKESLNIEKAIETFNSKSIEIYVKTQLSKEAIRSLLELSKDTEVRIIFKDIKQLDRDVDIWYNNLHDTPVVKGHRIISGNLILEPTLGGWHKYMEGI